MWGYGPRAFLSSSRCPGLLNCRRSLADLMSRPIFTARLDFATGETIEIRTTSELGSTVGRALRR